MQMTRGDLIYTLGEVGLPVITRLHQSFAPGLLTDGELEGWWKHPQSSSLILGKHQTGPVGILLFTLQRRHLRLDSVAVQEQHRRQGHGRSLFHTLVGMPDAHLFRVVTLAAGDENTPAHLWLASLGFKAIRVLHGRHGERDSYLFAWSRTPICVSKETACDSPGPSATP